MKKIISLIIILIIAGCATGAIESDINNGTLKTSESEWAVYGGWNVSSNKAKQLAMNHCGNLAQVYSFISEERTGTPGWTKLKSTITFSCKPDPNILFKASSDQCKKEIQNNSELDLIKDKVELYRTITDSSPPFEIATNKSFPSEREQEVIAKWAKIREGCVKRDFEISANAPKGNTPLEISYNEKINGYRSQINAFVSELIVALYQSKLTYGEFAQKRYEMVNAIISSERDY